MNPNTSSIMHDKTENFRMRLVMSELKKVDGNVTLAAINLGMNRGTLAKYRDKWLEQNKPVIYSYSPLEEVLNDIYPI